MIQASFQASLDVSMGVSGSGSRAPAECVITVDGEPIEDLYPFLTEVTVECTRAEHATARLTFATQRDELGSWVVQDSGVLAQWKRIVISAAFGDDTEEIMRGYIGKLRADYPQNAGDATMIVDCRDESLALDRKHLRMYLAKDGLTTDGAILRAIANKHGLGVEPGSKEGASGLELTQDTTDIDFLRERAWRNGYELIIRAGTIYFGPMRLEAKPQPTILVYAGPDSNCVQFSVDIDGHSPNRIGFDVLSPDGSASRPVVVTADLPRLGKEPVAVEGDGLLDFTWLMSGVGVTDETKLRAMAQNRVNELSMRVRAEGELDGTRYGHVLQVGLPVVVDGIGDSLGGRYYVDEVHHVFSLEGYRQRFKLLRNAYGDDVDWGGIDCLAGVR